MGLLLPDGLLQVATLPVDTYKELVLKLSANNTVAHFEPGSPVLGLPCAMHIAMDWR